MRWNLLKYIGGYIGITENKMEPTVVYWALERDIGKQDGTYYSTMVF